MQSFVVLIACKTLIELHFVLSAVHNLLLSTHLQPYKTGQSCVQYLFTYYHLFWYLKFSAVVIVFIFQDVGK